MSELYELRMRSDLENKFLVIGIKPYYTYKDGHKTDIVEGHIYDVLPLSDKTIGVKSVKVPGQALINRATITEKDIIIGFEGIRFTPYFNNRTNRKEISIKADKVIRP